MTDRPTFEDARRVAAAVVPPFLAGEVDLVQIVSTRFRSAAARPSRRASSFPCWRARSRTGRRRASRLWRHRGGIGRDRRRSRRRRSTARRPRRKLGYFEFEPDVEQLLERLIPLYAEASIYGALLEASASEHTARQRAMSAATENAEELIKTLRRVMNRARQDTITTEIMEIVGGAEALRSAVDAPHDLTHPQATEEQIA